MKKEVLPPEDKARVILDAAAKKLTLSRRLPVATYRLQFNYQFTFAQAKEIVSYLHDLGISDVYASPYFMAKKGSLHGYDILNHNLLNPDIGSEEEYREWVSELERYGLGQILDIVPNHMDITGVENIWWMDLLENGPGSIYADFFDIDWQPVKQELKNKVLLPILGEQYGRALENQELAMQFARGAFFVRYGEMRLPTDPISYNRILKFRLEDLEKKLGKEDPRLQELLSIITALEHLPPQAERNPEKILERQREKEIVKKRLANLYAEGEDVRSFIEENVRIFNGEKGRGGSFDHLDEFLNDQAYRLAHWRVATEEINYRRFFDINELAAIRMERLPVFREVHKLIFKLIREKKITGLRVDHPDGLYNPAEYFYRLQKGCFTQICFRELEREKLEKGEAPEAYSDDVFAEACERFYEEELFKNPSSPLRTPFYIVGEKILTGSERIPEDWPIWGTVGYAFLTPVNGIFVESRNARAFEGIYSRFIRAKMNDPDLGYEKKKLIMQAAMSGEINTLGHYLNRLSEKDRHTRDFTLNSLKTAITEVIACFPVYRTYVTDCGVVERDRHYIEQAVARAKRKNPALSETIFDFLKNILLLQYPEGFNEGGRREWLDFVLKFQQVTAPVMAKGLEDTVFYINNRLVSLNEIGGQPEKFGTTLDTFHGQNIERAQLWPYGLNATSTHDTKRSEDARARLNVISEFPEEWKKGLIRWRKMNKPKGQRIDGQRVPDPNEEYLLYQTLLGIWPLRPLEGIEGEVFRKRIKDYMLKAIREAKMNTSWISPNLPYEEALGKYMDALLVPSPDKPFLKDFEIWQRKISYFGMFNSLSQTLLKIASPGIPDFYQGTEIWDFSLVDPDNRRPVDFALRKKMLEELKAKIAGAGSDLKELARGLVQDWVDGYVKLYVTFRSLNYRRGNQQLFTEGAYIPLMVDGDLRDHVCAFARLKDRKVVLAAVPRFLSRLVKSVGELPVGPAWGESALVLPDEAAGSKFHNIFTDETLGVEERKGRRALPLGNVFAHFPVAMLETL